MTFWWPILIGLSFATAASAADLKFQVTDQSGAPVEDAVISVEPLDSNDLPPPKRVEIVQQNKQFKPTVTVIQTHAAVDFPNKDLTRHHVYSFSEPKRFEIKLYSGRPSAPILFDTPGTVVLGCNIHDFMMGFIRIVDTPYFAKTDASGSAVVRNVPNSAYRLKAWHYALAEQDKAVEIPIQVSASQSYPVQLKLRPFQFPERP